MSPPEVWGPAVWTLFHVLVEKISEESYHHIGKQLFHFIGRICKYLPCPDCSMDATRFLAKVNVQNLKNKGDLKNIIYIFHNYVNVKKRKRLFNYANMDIYRVYNIIPIINNFIAKYNTKGNLKLLSESFQRKFVIQGFKKWLSLNMRAFFPKPPLVSNPVISETQQAGYNNGSTFKKAILKENDDTQIIQEPLEEVVDSQQEILVGIDCDDVLEEPIATNESLQDSFINETPVHESSVEETVLQEEKEPEKDEEQEEVEEEPLVEEHEAEEPLVDEEIELTEEELNKPIFEEYIQEEPESELA